MKTSSNNNIVSLTYKINNKIYHTVSNFKWTTLNFIIAEKKIDLRIFLLFRNKKKNYYKKQIKIKLIRKYKYNLHSI